MNCCEFIYIRIWLEEKRKKEREREREEKKKGNAKRQFNRQFWKTSTGFLAFFLLPFFPFSSGRAASAARRFGSMRAQMGLCLMKFGPSCTCHFRGISDRRPLHCLEHNLRNWREPRFPSLLLPDSILLDISPILPFSCFKFPPLPLLFLSIEMFDRASIEIHLPRDGINCNLCNCIYNLYIRVNNVKQTITD